MTHNIDLLTMPGLWPAQSLQLSNGLTINIYQDPTKQFFSISPVATLEGLKDWYNAQCACAYRVCRPKSTSEAMHMRDLLWTRTSYASDRKYEEEEWIRVGFKNRYLLCELRYADDRVDPGFTNKDLYDLVRDSIALNFGDLGSGRLSVSLGVKYWNPITGLGVLRIARDDIRTLWTAVGLITHVKGRRGKVAVLHCSGTIRKCEAHAARHIDVWLQAATHPLEQRRRSALASDMLSNIHQLQP